MSLNLADSESAYSYGKVVYDQFQKEFMAQWYRPLAEMQLGMLLGTIAQHEIPNVNPEALKRAQDLLKKMTGEM